MRAPGLHGSTAASSFTLRHERPTGRAGRNFAIFARSAVGHCRGLNFVGTYPVVYKGFARPTALAPTCLEPESIRSAVKYLSVCLLALATPVAFAYEFTDFTESQQEMLQEGQCLLWTHVEDDGKKHFVCSAILLDSPLEAVWALIDDKEVSPEYLTGLEVSKIVGKEEDALLIYQETKPAALSKSFRYVVKHVPIPYKRVEFTRHSGDLRHIEGAWHFDGVNAGKKTLLVYELHIDPGRLFPQNFVARSQKKKLPQVMAEIRKKLDDMKVQPVVTEEDQRPQLVNANRGN